MGTIGKNTIFFSETGNFSSYWALSLNKNIRESSFLVVKSSRDWSSLWVPTLRGPMKGSVLSRISNFCECWGSYNTSSFWEKVQPEFPVSEKVPESGKKLAWVCWSQNNPGTGQVVSVCNFHGCPLFLRNRSFSRKNIGIIMLFFWWKLCRIYHQILEFL